MTLEQRFANLSVVQILNNYKFPTRFLAYYNSQVAKEALKKAKAGMKDIKDADPRSLKAVEIAERYGNGEDFSKEELEKVYRYAHYAYNHLCFYVHFSLIASDTIWYILEYSSSSSYFLLINRAYLFENSYVNDKFKKSLLLDLIETRMTKLEKLVTFGIT